MNVSSRSSGRGPWDLLRRLGALVVALALSSAGPLHAAGESPRGILLITCEAVRPDHTSFFGWHRPTTPELDRFFAQSVVFENALTPISAAPGAHLTMMTGLSPAQHGVISIGAPKTPWKSSEGGRLLAEMLTLQKYRCNAYVSSRLVGRATGLEAGFPVFDEPDQELRSPAAIAAKANRWLEVHGKEERFFLWLHFKGGLEPNVPDQPYLTMFDTDDGVRAAIAKVGVEPERFSQGGFNNVTLIRMFFPELDGQVTPSGALLPQVDRGALERLYNRYDGDLRDMDAAIGSVLAKLESVGAASRTVVAFASTSGQSFGERLILSRGEVSPEISRVFAAVRAPGLEPRRSKAPFALVDLLSTAVVRAGLGDKVRLGTGRDALSETRELAFVVRPTRDKEKNSPGPMYAAYSTRWKYVHRTERTDQLFDLSADPGEQTNVLDAHPEEAATLKAAILAEMAPLLK